MKENVNERDYITAGDPLLWLNRTFPIAVRLDAFGVYEENQEVDTDLETPWGLKLLSGGALYKNIGYYFYFYMSERGEVAGIEDAYVHFDNIFKTELDVMVGQFQTSDPLMKRELRLTFEDYMFYTRKIGYSDINLTYDRGVMLTYGINKTGTEFVGIVGNGNGKGVADEETRKFDKDKYKNLAFRAKQGIGENIGIGGYFYYGKEKIAYEYVADSITALFSGTNKVTYWGPDLDITVGPLAFTGNYLMRKDTQPEANIKDIETSGIIAELIYSPQLDKSRYYLTALYNRIDSDLDQYDYESGTLGATYLVARNLRLTAEFTRDMQKDANRFVLGLVTAF